MFKVCPINKIKEEISPGKNPLKPKSKAILLKASAIKTVAKPTAKRRI